jgi:hypothetical protein
MGGNAVIRGWAAGRIPNTKEVIPQLVGDLNELFGALERGLRTKFVPSGSCARIFKKNYSPDRMYGKDSFGDIDVMFDQDKLADVQACVTEGYSYVTHNPGDGGFDIILACVGVQKTDQLITLWQWRGKQIIQIDFEPAEFVGGEPTEWAEFAHSSNDENQGIKGVFHKHLLRALNAPDVKEVKIMQKSGKMKDTKSAEYALSVSGLRRKLFPVIVSSDTGFGEFRSQLEVDGKLVYHESGMRDFVRDLDVIQAFYFGKEKTNNIHKGHLKSFSGLAGMIVETRNASDQLKVIHGFANTCWGKGAQKLYRNDDKKDFEEKKTALDRLAYIFKVPNDLWEGLIDGYYGNEAEEYSTL